MSSAVVTWASTHRPGALLLPRCESGRARRLPVIAYSGVPRHARGSTQASSVVSARRVVDDRDVVPIGCPTDESLVADEAHRHKPCVHGPPVVPTPERRGADPAYGRELNWRATCTTDVRL